jgi:hypothetical protein
MRRVPALFVAPLLAVTLTACGSTTATAGFKGEQHAAAQTIANLQNDATAAEQKKICANDLAAALVKRLGGSEGCERAIKNQLAEVYNLETSVKSVALGADGRTATAQVKNIRDGKTVTSAVSLLKEDGKWKISGLS